MSNGVGDSVGQGQASSEENIAVQAANADTAKNFQDQSTAINVDASFAMKSDQAYQTLVQSIKVM